MTNTAPQPILITGGARRIGLALAHALLSRHQPVIVAYRSEYPALEGLRAAGAHCLQGDFSAHEGIYDFARRVAALTPKLRGIVHNASAWLAENSGTPPEQTLQTMLQIHVYTPYLLNQLLEPLLCGQGEAGADIIHLTDYVVEKGSDKHIAYAASKAALDNMTRSFARKLAPEVKVNAIAPALIMFNPGDDEQYRRQALDKSLMKIAPGEQEIVNAIEFLLNSRFVTGRTIAVDGGRPLR
ncbi:dihydromonapterin reductase [Enterobacillus tribolii]|uniref:Dihydromonapterin reductase n=1 Tax=Enterobacillus tribolii TaxID=1487935 RepID=A0A370R460_9GAMM|nr:dihydromonapterin reductase [Enterobacillus tribolii]MBW7983159.1 dihydromonapterin reductase [Enterobacillus tribolii]RDK97214.1 dihydromonapterin reductase/dihydrofolate reductase [Enterobacillus tribolii]